MRKKSNVVKNILINIDSICYSNKYLIPNLNTSFRIYVSTKNYFYSDFKIGVKVFYNRRKVCQNTQIHCVKSLNKTSKTAIE